MKEAHQDILRKERGENEKKLSDLEQKLQSEFKKKLKKKIKKEREQFNIKLKQEKESVALESDKKIKDLFEKISSEYEENLISFKEEAERKSRHCSQLEKELLQQKTIMNDLQEVIKLHEEKKLRDMQLLEDIESKKSIEIERSLSLSKADKFTNTPIVFNESSQQVRKIYIYKYIFKKIIILLVKVKTNLIIYLRIQQTLK